MKPSRFPCHFSNVWTYGCPQVIPCPLTASALGPASSPSASQHPGVPGPTCLTWGPCLLKFFITSQVLHWASSPQTNTQSLPPCRTPSLMALAPACHSQALASRCPGPILPVATWPHAGLCSSSLHAAGLQPGCAEGRKRPKQAGSGDRRATGLTRAGAWRLVWPQNQVSACAR